MPLAIGMQNLKDKFFSKLNDGLIKSKKILKKTIMSYIAQTLTNFIPQTIINNLKVQFF